MANLTLDPAPGSYSMQDQANLRRRLEDGFRRLLAKDLDNYLGQGRVIYTDRADGSLWEGYVENGEWKIAPL